MRSDFLNTLVDRVAAVGHEGVARIAITGVDGSGKTRLADELAPLVRHKGITVIRSSIDGFHNPRAVRYARGKESPEGFYRDSFNLDAFKRALLDPLSPGGSLSYRTAAFDHRTDRPVDAPAETAPVPSVLIVDGIFLQRPELAHYWDLTIFLDVPFAQSFARMSVRDGCPADEDAPANQRYRQGQQLYFAECDPQARAEVLVDYADLDAPKFLRF